MQLGAKGERLIKGYEKLELLPYRDSGDVLTVGWGHTARAGGYIPQEGVAITEAQAEQIFRHDIAGFVRDVNRLITAPVSQNEFDALVSFDFNTGKLAQSSILKHLNSGQRERVPADFMQWDHVKEHGELKESKGLARRRAAEIALWNTPGADIENPEDAMARVGPEAARRQAKGMHKSKIGMTSAAIGTAATVQTGASAIDAVQKVQDQMSTASGFAEGIIAVRETFDLFVSSPSNLLILLVVAAAVAIWFWRYGHMQDDGV